LQSIRQLANRQEWKWFFAIDEKDPKKAVKSVKYILRRMVAKSKLPYNVQSFHDLYLYVGYDDGRLLLDIGRPSDFFKDKMIAEERREATQAPTRPKPDEHGLTELEKSALKGIREQSMEFAGDADSTVEGDEARYLSGISVSSWPGVLSSLSKKGLAYAFDERVNNRSVKMVSLSQKGVEALEALDSSKDQGQGVADFDLDELTPEEKADQEAFDAEVDAYFDGTAEAPEKEPIEEFAGLDDEKEMQEHKEKVTKKIKDLQRDFDDLNDDHKDAIPFLSFGDARDLKTLKKLVRDLSRMVEDGADFHDGESPDKEVNTMIQTAGYTLETLEETLGNIDVKEEIKKSFNESLQANLAAAIESVS
jgi:DNA-binding PadR family transcriptional regulator